MGKPVHVLRRGGSFGGLDTYSIGRCRGGDFRAADVWSGSIAGQHERLLTGIPFLFGTGVPVLPFGGRRLPVRSCRLAGEVDWYGVDQVRRLVRDPCADLHTRRSRS